MKEKIILGILIVNLLAAGLYLGSNNEVVIDKKSSAKVDNEEKLVEIIPSKYDNLTLSEVDKEFLNKTIFFNDLSSFKDSVKSTSVSYPFEELYKGVNKNYKKETTTNNFLDVDTLYKKVLENNRVYQNQFNNDTFYATTNDFVYDVSKRIIKTIKSLEDKGISFDTQHLNKTLEGLKIFRYKGYNYGYYNGGKGIFGINEVIDEENINEIIDHEIMHVLSTSSKEELDNLNLLNRVGFMYEEFDDEINPFNYTWFSESASESLSTKLNNIDTPYVYATQIKSLEGMKLATFNPSLDLEKTIFSTDINDLYKLFGNLKNNEVNNMFYAYTILYNAPVGEEGFNFYQKLKSLGYEVTPKEYESFKSNIESSINVSLAKEFYINLANKIENKTCTLEEIFKLISIYELEVSREVWYQSKYEDLEYFLEEYSHIQTSFFDYLSSSLGVSTDYLKELYYMYNNEINIENVSISFLTNEENEFLNYINESRCGNKKDSIVSVYENNFNTLSLG